MKKMDMIWTKIAALALGAILTVGVGATLSATLPSNEVEAATTETHRVWFGVGTTTWNNDSAKTFIYYWTGTGDSKVEPYVWPGVEMKTDDANGLRYFDVAQSNWNIIFVRRNSTNTATWNQTANLTGAGNFNSKKFIPNIALNNGTWNPFTPSTTTIVAAFAATIDTKAEACSASNAQAAVNAYNDLSTFEQDQFDSYSFGSPAKTGLETLNYLRTLYSISTPLNANWADSYSSKNIAVIITIALLGVTSLAGFYFLRKKKSHSKSHFDPL